MASQDHIKKKHLPLFLLQTEEESEINGITRFQKLVFLAQEGGLSDDPVEPLDDAETFDYEANDYGPFSKELYDTLDYLKREGYINVDETLTPSGNERKDYSIADDGEDLIEEKLGDIADDPTDLRHDLKVLRAVKRLYSGEPIFELIDDLYAEYPDYAKDSVLR